MIRIGLSVATLLMVIAEIPTGDAAGIEWVKVISAGGGFAVTCLVIWWILRWFIPRMMDEHKQQIQQMRDDHRADIDKILKATEGCPGRGKA